MAYQNLRENEFETYRASDRKMAFPEAGFGSEQGRGGRRHCRAIFTRTVATLVLAAGARRNSRELCTGRERACLLLWSLHTCWVDHCLVVDSVTTAVAGICANGNGPIGSRCPAFQCIASRRT